MIEIFDNILDIAQSNRYDQEVSKLKWSYEYQPTTTALNMHWYSDGELFIYDLLEDLIDNDPNRVPIHLQSSPKYCATLIYFQWPNRYRMVRPSQSG